MNIPVKVELKNLAGQVQTVLDDELHNLINDGLLTYKDAIKALKDAGLKLDKRFYPWLNDVENKATGQFDKPAPEKPEPKPDLLSPEAEKAVTASAKPDNTEGVK